jgi:adenylate kinase
MRLILLSPPGAGKGTLAAGIGERTGIGHVSSGDVVRAEIARGTELGRQLADYSNRGDLVPDEVLFELLTPLVLRAAESTGGFMLDGFPRTMAQATRTAQLGVELDLVGDAVIFLTAPDEVLIRRLLNRAADQNRADDDPVVIRHRLDVFHSQTAPLVDYYRSRGILLEVDADRSPDDILTDVLDRLAARRIPACRPR